MLSKLITFCFTWLVVTSLVSGCSGTTQYYPVNSARSVYVTSMPPAPKKEAAAAKPSKTHVWINGSWDWNQTEKTWTWKKGRWKKPPKKGYVWEEANCEKRSDRVFVYTPGYWILEKKAEPAKPAKPADPAKPAEPKKNKTAK